MSHLVQRIRDRLYRQWVNNLSLSQLEAHLQKRRGLVILCYHSLSEELDDYPYRTRLQAFDHHLTFLHSIFDIVPVTEAVQLLESGALTVRPRPLAAITFDDGFRDNLYIATPVLEKHHLPALLFPAKDHISYDGLTYLNEEELRVLCEHPLWTVGAHSVSHNSMYSWVQEDLEREISGSKLWLSDLTGESPEAFAYPQGKLSRRVIEAVKPHFKYAYTVTKRYGNTFDRHQILRLCLTQSEDDLVNLARALVMAKWEEQP